MTKLTSSKRLVVKIGSSILVDEAKGQIRRDWLEALTGDVARLHKKGCEVVLVSSGAIRLGRTHLKLAAGVLKLEESQAAAATGQIQLAHAYQAALARHGITVAQVLLTLDDSEARRRYLNARQTMATLLGLGYTYTSASFTNGPAVTGHTIPLSLTVPFLWHPVGHFVLGAGPALVTQLANKSGGMSGPRTTDYGITALIGGTIGGR